MSSPNNQTPPNQQRWYPAHPELGASVNFSLRKLADIAQDAKAGVDALKTGKSMASATPQATIQPATAQQAPAAGWQQTTQGLWMPYSPIIYPTSGYTITGLTFQVAEYQILGSIIFVRIRATWAAGGASTALIQVTTPPVPPADNLSTLTCAIYNANAVVEAGVCTTNSNLFYITRAAAGNTFSSNASPLSGLVITGLYHV